MTHRIEIERHFVDSSTLCVIVSGLEGGVLKKLGTDCNRTADSRMVLTDRQDEVQNIAETRTGGSWVLYQSAAGGGCCLRVKR